MSPFTSSYTYSRLYIHQIYGLSTMLYYVHVRTCVFTECIVVSSMVLCMYSLQYGWRAVHFAAYYGHKAVLEELLERYPHLKDKREQVTV